MTNWYKPNGDLNLDAFKTPQDVETFRAEQEAAWTALSLEDLSQGARTAVERNLQVLRDLRRTLINLRNQGQSSQAGINQINSKLYGSGGNAMPASVLQSPSFKDLQTSVSTSAAVFYEAFRRNVVTLADAREPHDLLGAFWDVAPSLGRTAELADLLSRERENTRRTLRNELARLSKNDKTRLEEWEGKLQEARQAYVGWARRRSTRWGRLTRSWEDRHRESERRIRSVEDTYKEQLGLKAPVKYWKDKAAQHQKAEFWARLWVIAFFPMSLAGLAFAFITTGKSLLESAMAAGQDGSQPFPTAIFIVASAGLASCAGLVFWVGRLLTKLYLSQHHLRQDADERATMTETYLALIENGAASTDDRQVILNALFRNTPDGIVKEDGGLDPSIAAALGKFLAK